MTGGRVPSWLDAADDGQTPLDPDEAGELRLAWVSTRGDLNSAEATNITQGMRWAERQVQSGVAVHTDHFLRELHLRLFGQVWGWAGRYRTTERNIGIAPAEISTALRHLFDDVSAWQEFNSYPLDERAARLHHRLTWIHPFPNGNGRTARATADLFLRANGAPPFPMGAATLPPAEARARYLEAIRAADAHDLTPLLAFVRS